MVHIRDRNVVYSLIQDVICFTNVDGPCCDSIGEVHVSFMIEEGIVGDHHVPAVFDWMFFHVKGAELQVLVNPIFEVTEDIQYKAENAPKLVGMIIVQASDMRAFM